MQIHTDKLPTLIEFAHRGLLRRNCVSTPSMRARDGHEERRPRSFMTSAPYRRPILGLAAHLVRIFCPHFRGVSGH